MERLSQDVDLLRYEAELFGPELHLSSQVLCAGADGVIAGTSFASVQADFETAGVQAGHVIHLQSGGGSVNGPFEVVERVGPNALTVSVVRGGLQAPVPPPADATFVTYQVCTYGPQAWEMALVLSERFGLRPGRPDGTFALEDVVDVEVFRRASVLGILAGVYAMLGSRATEGETMWKKSLHYRRRFEEAVERCRVALDTGDDGVADATHLGGARRLRRD